MSPRGRILMSVVLLLPALLTALGSQATATGELAQRCAGKAATIVGTAGPDTLQGTGRTDVIVGRGGNDTIFGLGGADRICGGRGDDTLKGGNGPDRLVGGPGDDILWGEAGNDQLAGGPGRDSLLGDCCVSPHLAGDDVLRGGPGADVLDDGAPPADNAAPDTDRLYGQGGDDRVHTRDWDSLDLAHGGPGDDYCAPDFEQGSGHTDRKVGCETGQ